jgi:hypothetical protein
MFIGHFAIALIAKKADPKPSLGTTFLAAQWLDLLWPFLLLTGIESVVIEPGNSAATPLNFTHYPISHSLLAVIGWSLVFGIFYYLTQRNLKSALLIGFLVLSHWLLDFIVHVPDLPLTPFTDYKVGLGLWNYKYVTLAIEIIFFIFGVVIYTNTTSAINKTGSIAFWALIVFLLAVHIMNSFSPPPSSVKAIGFLGLTQWILVAWAYGVDKNRTVKNKA